MDDLNDEGGFSHAPEYLTYGVHMKQISLVGASILAVYLALLYGMYVPDWQFTVHNPDSIYNGTTLTVTCGVRGKLDPPCNVVGYIDREVLGINHMYKHPAWRRSEACTENSPYEGPFKRSAPSWCYAPFEPEGILSSISAILSTIIGLHFGHVLVHLQDHSSRLKHWLLLGLALLAFGLILHFTHAIPLNKQLYTLSYVCVTSGAAALVFSAFYIVVDIWGLTLLFLPLKWIGMNAMLVYVMAAEGIFAGFINGWYYDDPHNTLTYWIQKHVFINVWHSKRVGILLYVIFAEILFWAIVGGEGSTAVVVEGCTARGGGVGSTAGVGVCILGVGGGPTDDELPGA
ncbi:hypothetical protein LR48_Vigan1453s000100 [Vigna angularis]|nr:hypothetical protein LR48_Vigan1453s000100 [Vigna angularis]